MKQRICFFLPSLRGGGAQRVAVEIANGLAARGWPIDLVIAKDQGHYFDEVSCQVNVINLGCSRTVASVWGLARYLKEARPAALCSALPHGCVIAWLAGRASFWTGRFIVRETNARSTPGVRRSYKDRAIRAICRFVYQRADVVVAPSIGVASELPYSQAVFIPNPLDRKKITSAAATPIPNEYGRFILGVGEFVPQKRFQDLIKGFARLPNRQDLSLVILGDGEQRDALLAVAKQNGVAGSVALPGFDPNPFRYMARCDVFVLSSGWEGMPNVLLQAMACGAPVVATDCPHGPREVLRQGRLGELVPVGDVIAMASAIERQLQRGRVGYPAEALVPYDYERVISLWEKVLTGS
jgi:glycosyltransferase involved in cell wall biosynthesis